MLKFYVPFYVSYSLLEDACDTLVCCKLLFANEKISLFYRM